MAVYIETSYGLFFTETLQCVYISTNIKISIKGAHTPEPGETVLGTTRYRGETVQRSTDFHSLGKTC